MADYVENICRIEKGNILMSPDVYDSVMKKYNYFKTLGKLPRNRIYNTPNKMMEVYFKQKYGIRLVGRLSPRKYVIPKKFMD